MQLLLKLLVDSQSYDTKVNTHILNYSYLSLPPSLSLSLSHTHAHTHAHTHTHTHTHARTFECTHSYQL